MYSTPIGAALFAALTYFLSFEIKYYRDIELDGEKESLNLLPEKYDFIIVGAGTAGCYIANRLSKSYTVLLVEAGGPQPPILDIPAFRTMSIFHPEINSLYRSTPQSFANNRSLITSAGKMMGGSFAHNSQLWNRGNSRDYDNWAALTKDSSWEYKNLLPVFRKIENYIGPFKSAQRGTHGPIPVFTSDPPILNTYIKAAKESGYGYYYPNGPQREGLAALDLSQINGRAVTTCRLMIDPIAGKRKNLYISKYSEVTKILTKFGSAIGVKYKRNNMERSVFAHKEVIVSSGALGSPMLLFKSGIGPAKMLNKAKIDVVADLPVGKYLEDHPGLVPTYSINDPSKLQNIYNNVSIEKIERYLKYGDDGILSKPVFGGPQGFFVSQNAVKAGEKDWPDIHLLHEDDTTKSASTFNTVVALTRPKGVGEISLDTKAWLKGERDDVKLALINPRFLELRSDQETLLQGIRITQKILYSNAFKELDIKLVPLPECANSTTVDSDKYWYCAMASSGSNHYHLVGGCFGQEDKTAVVDTDFIVLGVNRLRIIDASTFPKITNANTNAPTVLLAERGADKIIKEYSFPFGK